MNIKRIAGNTWKTLIWPAAIYVFFLIATRVVTPGSSFGSWNSFVTVVKQAITCAVLAVAMSSNMLNGRWDFSMGIIMIMSSFFAAPLVSKYDLGAAGLLALCIAFAVIMCCLNGALYLLIRVPSLVVSVGMLMVYETLILVVNNGSGARLSGMSNTVLGRSPWIYILGFGALLVFYIINSRTRFGYNVRSLGNNQVIANSVGINEKKNVMLCYVVCGIFVGVAGALNLSTKGSIEGSSLFSNHMGIMFGAFPPVFIGLYLSRYTNFTLGVFLGAIAMKLLTAGLLALGLPSSAQDIGVGLFLFLFIALTTNQGRLADRRLRRLKAKRAMR